MVLNVPQPQSLPEGEVLAIEDAIENSNLPAIDAFAQRHASKWFTPSQAAFAADKAIYCGNRYAMASLAACGIVPSSEVLVRVASGHAAIDAPAEECRDRVRHVLESAGPTWQFRRLMEALRLPEPGRAAQALVDCGLDVNNPGFPRAALTAAVTNGTAKACEVLVHLGADVMHNDAEALKEAVRLEREEITKVVQRAWARAQALDGANDRRRALR